ncbi:MAG: DUF4124 domain-containing protein [Burkholderiales bacterium]|nr:DUF4124 domain-containing protein [Burkholderiales bacterium]
MMARLIRRFAAIFVTAIVAGVLPTTADAQMYKCKGPSGAVSYKDSPCDQTEQRQSTNRTLGSGEARKIIIPKANEPGLWETKTVLRLRASHPKENANWQRAPSKELEKAGDHKYFFGVPLHTQKCTSNSPIDAMLTKYAFSCARQIKAHFGRCEANESVPGMNGRQETFNSITGDYRSEMHIRSRMMQGKDPNGKPVYDDAEIDIAYLGSCSSNMKEGDVFVVEDGSRLVKQR